MPTGTVRIRTGVSGNASSSSVVTGEVHSGSGGGEKQVYSDTTANWNAQPTLISKKDVIYVYTDYATKDGQPISALKVGDGLAYVVDLPFTCMGNVTDEQIAFWNNKITAYMDDVDVENLILSKL